MAGTVPANSPVAGSCRAYPIGAIFHVPHGLSNALVLTQVLRFNLSKRRVRRTGADRRPQIAGNERRPAGAALVDGIALICRAATCPRWLPTWVLQEAISELAEEDKQTRSTIRGGQLDDVGDLHRRGVRQPGGRLIQLKDGIS
jgi:alcohol dehydrogenase class IV